MCASMGNICQFKMLQNVGNKKYHTQISWLTLNILGIDAQIILAFFLRTLIDEYIYFLILITLIISPKQHQATGPSPTNLKIKCFSASGQSFLYK